MLTLLGRALAAELLVAGTFLTAYSTACRLLSREPTLLRWTGVVAAGSFFASVGFHLLCALRVFHLTTALASIVGLTAAALALGTGERPLDQWLRRDRCFVRGLLG